MDDDRLCSVESSDVKLVRITHGNNFPVTWSLPTIFIVLGRISRKSIPRQIQPIYDH